ncbi:MAG TPA: hypothetical protein VGD33_12595, partial [Chitinophagaceae bacterium]
MQFNQTYPKPLKGLFFLFVLMVVFSHKDGYSQTTYLPFGAKENILIERMEIKLGKDSVFNFSKNRPFSRKEFIPRILTIDSAGLSKVDMYNRYTTIINNLEWAGVNRNDYLSRKPIGKRFYQTPATLFEVDNPDFYLAV